MDLNVGPKTGQAIQTHLSSAGYSIMSVCTCVCCTHTCVLGHSTCSVCVYTCVIAYMQACQGLSSRSGQVLCMCFPCPDGLSAGLGQGAGRPHALPPNHCRRSTRPCRRLPCTTPSRLKVRCQRKKRDRNGIESLSHRCH